MDIPGWSVRRDYLTKTFTLKDFLSVIQMVNDIAGLAEKSQHHPDLEIHSYNKLTVRLKTHSENKITQKDYDLANKIEKL